MGKIGTGSQRRFQEEIALLPLALKEITEPLTVNTKMYLSKLKVTIFKDKKVRYIIITN